MSRQILRVLGVLVLIAVVLGFNGQEEVKAEGNIYKEEIQLEPYGRNFTVLQVKVEGGTIESIELYDAKTGDVIEGHYHAFHYITDSNYITEIIPFRFFKEYVDGKMLVTVKSETGDYKVKVNKGNTEETAIDYTDMKLKNGNYISNNYGGVRDKAQYVKVRLEGDTEYYISTRTSTRMEMYDPTGKLIKSTEDLNVGEEVNRFTIKTEEGGVYLIKHNEADKYDLLGLSLSIAEVIDGKDNPITFQGEEKEKDNKRVSKRVGIRVDGKESYVIRHDSWEKDFYYEVRYATKYLRDTLSELLDSLGISKNKSEKVINNVHDDAYINIIDVNTSNTDTTARTVNLDIDRFKRKTGDDAKHVIEELNEEDRDNSMVLDPIDSFGGNLKDNKSLLSYGGTNPLNFQLSYDSIAGTSKSLSWGFTHNFETYIEDKNDTLNLYWTPKSVVRFKKEGNKYESINNSQKGISVVKTTNGYDVVDVERGKYSFDKEGKLLTATDRVGRVTSYYYNKGLLSKVENDKGQIFDFQYNGNDKLKSVKDVEGRIVEFLYDTTGRLVTVKDVEGKELKYSYNYDKINGNYKVTTSNYDGVELYRNKYDSLGRVIEQYNKDTGTAKLKYDEYTDNEKVFTTVTNGERKEVYEHDKDGNLLSVTDGEGYKETYEYDSNRNVISKTDKNGNKVSYEYDNKNRLIKETYKDNTSKEYTYDEQNNILKVKTEDNLEIKNEYKNNQLVKVTDKNGTVANYEYDDKGNLVRVTSGTKEIKNQYDKKGYLTEINDNGTVTKFTNDPIGRVIKVDLSTGETVKNIYDNVGNLKETEFSDGTKEQYEYNVFGDVVKHTDREGNVTTYEYNAVGNLTKEVGGDIERTYRYDKFGNVTTETHKKNGKGIITNTYKYDNVGNLIGLVKGSSYLDKYEYDGNGNVISKTSGDHTEYYKYDDKDNLIEYKDGNGNITKYKYDVVDNLVKETIADGTEIKYTYDNVGNLLTELDGNGNKTTYKYDGSNNLIKVTDPLGAVTSYEYNSKDLLTKEINALGEETKYTYNAEGNITSVVNALNEAVYNYGYDNKGNITEVVDANGNVTKIGYDFKGNVVDITDALGNVVELNEYDQYGMLKSSTDALNNVVTRDYDSVGNLVKEVNERGKETTYTYSQGRLLTGVNEKGNIKTEYNYNSREFLESIYAGTYSKKDQFDWDGNGNLVKDTPNNLGTKEYSYDKQDRITKEVNGRGQELKYEYDNNGNLIKEVTEEGTTTHTYDAADNLIKTVSPNGTIKREYDLLGRVISKEENGKKITYQYDKRGHLTEIGYPNGKKVKYTYDTLGNMLTVTDWLGNVTKYEYNELNQLVKTVNANGTVEEREYDKKGQLVKIKTTLNGEEIKTYTYAYDEVGNIVKENDKEYVYDDLDRLTAAGDNEYTYGLNGNIDKYKVEGKEITFTYGVSDELKRIGTNQTVVDKDGNLTKYTMDGKDYESVYDTFNRLIKHEENEYGYNSENERTSILNGEELTEFVIDNDSGKYSKVLEETTGDESKYYIYGQGLIGEYNEDTFTTYHYDLRGSTTYLTDESGKVIGEVEYDEYGKLLSKDEEVETRFLYNGQHGVQTDDNGLYYMRARYYNTDLKRFMNRDVLFGNLYEPHTLNRYSFVNGNPISYNDPFGLERESSTGTSVADTIHGLLDIGGLVPVLGEVLDVVNGIWYLAEGDYRNAAISGISSIPIVGNAAKLGKYGVKATTIAKKDITKELLTTKPKNSPRPEKWIDKGGSIKIKDGDTWIYKDWEGNEVSYIKGFPDFKGAGFVRQEVDIGEFTTRSKDFRKADKIRKKYGDGTWHHHEDGRTLQDVRTDIHKRFTHRGGISIKGQRR